MFIRKLHNARWDSISRLVKTEVDRQLGGSGARQRASHFRAYPRQRLCEESCNTPNFSWGIFDFSLRQSATALFVF
jgi:hypothetical protein